MPETKTPWERQTIPPGATGWIQWKGTTVCMDIHCLCGAHHHIDDSFVYSVKCSDCGQAYLCNGHIELVPLTKGEEEEELSSMKLLGEICYCVHKTYNGNEPLFDLEEIRRRADPNCINCDGTGFGKE